MQARYARSMEEVVKALVDDASQLAGQAQVSLGAEAHSRWMDASCGNAFSVLRPLTVISVKELTPAAFPTALHLLQIHDSYLRQQHGHLNDTREALLRCVWTVVWGVKGGGTRSHQSH